MVDIGWVSVCLFPYVCVGFVDYLVTWSILVIVSVNNVLVCRTLV